MIVISFFIPRNVTKKYTMFPIMWIKQIKSDIKGTVKKW